MTQSDNSIKPVLVVCPHCRKEIRARPGWIGQSAKCKSCGQSFVLQPADGQAQASPIPAVQQPPAQPEPPAAELVPPPKPKPGPPPAPASLGPGSWPQVGDWVFTDIDGTSWWEPAKVSQVLPDRYLVTILRGQQCYTTLRHIVPLKLCAGARIVFLDEEKGGYALGIVAKVVGDAVQVMKFDDTSVWLHASVVWPETIPDGAKMVGKDAQGQVVEMATVARKSMSGYRLVLPDGTETNWRDDELGAKLVFPPQSVSKDAPASGPPLLSLVKDTRAQIGAGAMLLMGSLWIAMPMFGEEGYGSKFAGSVASFLLIAGVTALFSRVVAPRLRLPILQYAVGAAFVGIIFLMALIGKPGGWKLGSTIWYGTVAIVGMAWGFPGSGKKDTNARKTVKPFQKDPEWYDKMDTQCPYRVGERVFYCAIGDEFRRIGTVQSQTTEEVEVLTSDGQTVRLPRKRVYPYNLLAMERVMGLHPGQGSFAPAILLHIDDEEFTLRFDDWQTAKCRMGDVWFTVRKAALELLGMPDAKIQEVLSASQTAMQQAQAACETGNFQAAHQVLARTLKTYPFLDDLHMGQAATYQEERNYMMVAAEAKLAIGPMSDNPGLYTMLGNAYLNLKRPVEAEEAFRAAVNMNPDEPGHWHNLGNALEAQGRSVEARNCFEQSRKRGGPGA
jgi:hypothetical protein